MKYILILSTFLLLGIVTKAQIVFNRIIEDTILHIPNSIIPLDTGYVILTGTNNEHGIRSFAFTYADLHGEKQWKKVFGEESFENWEGQDNNLVENMNSYLFTGSYTNVNNNYRGIHYSIFDSSFNQTSKTILLYDTILRKSFNTILSTTEDIYLTGQSYEYNKSNYRLYLAKVNSNKEVIWEKHYGSEYEAGFRIIETSDNNILIGGLTFSFPTSITDEDWYLLKVDTAGNVLWEKGLGNGSLYDGGVAGIIETQDSNYIACGGYPAFEAAGNNFYDACLRKVAKDGELMWTKYYRTYSLYTSNITTMKDYFNSIYEDVNGNLFALSSTYDAKPFYRGALTKMDSCGNIIFRRLYFAIDEFSNEQYLKVMKPTNDGGFILAGYGDSYNWYDYNPPQQAWLVKTDSLGLDGLCYTEAPELNIDIELPETICTNDTIEVYAYIAGKSAPYTIGFSTGQIIDSIFYPPLFVPIEIGLSQTSIVVGDSEYYSELITEATLCNHEWGQCIAKPVEFYTPHTSGSQEISITVTDAYGESKTITKSLTVIDCEDNIETENVCPVKLYPNPAKDKVYIDIPVTSASLSHLENKVEIYNSVGQIVKTTNVHKGLNVIDVSDLASGSYIVKITTEDGTFSLSFEKE